MEWQSLPGPSVEKKRKTSGDTRFKFSWNLPENIMSSAKSNKFAYCKLCLSHFSITHGGINGKKCHCEGKGHSDRLKKSQQSSMTKFMDTARSSQTNKVIAAEVKMTRFITMHNLPFSPADHLSELLPSMFPDSKIAADFSCKRMKTKAIICDALEPYLKDQSMNISGLLHLTCFVMDQMREVILKIAHSSC